MTATIAMAGARVTRRLGRTVPAVVGLTLFGWRPPHSPARPC
jgi:hypothetical protein